MRLLPILVWCGLVAGILLSIEFGYQIGRRRWSRLPPDIRSTSGAVEASIFALMGLLVTFTFYGAATRFDVRRNLIVAEADAIGTAYLRLDLLPPEAQPQLREDFRKYLRSRLAVTQKIPDLQAVMAELARSESLQDEIWKRAVEATKSGNPVVQSLVLPPVNQMLDGASARTASMLMHPPLLIFAMLGLTVAVSCALAGYGMSVSDMRDWVPIITFALVLSTALYTIIDYEFPRVGFLRLDSFDNVLVETLGKMK